MERGGIKKLELRLLDTAKRGGLVTYEQIAPIVGEVPHSPRLWNMLGEISEKYEASDGILLSAIVVNKREGYPGNSFFDLAESLDREFDDRLAFWAGEVRRIHEWAKGLSKSG